MTQTGMAAFGRWEHLPVQPVPPGSQLGSLCRVLPAVPSVGCIRRGVHTGQLPTPAGGGWFVKLSLTRSRQACQIHLYAQPIGCRNLAQPWGAVSPLHPALVSAPAKQQQAAAAPSLGTGHARDTPVSSLTVPLYPVWPSTLATAQLASWAASGCPRARCPLPAPGALGGSQ